LFALALQLVLSFAHVHADDLAASAAGAAIHAGLPASKTAPPTKPHGLADDYCAICALIHLAAAVLPSAPPSLPLQIAFEGTQLELTATAIFAASVHASFQARAPPIA
jgi:hypothetical protein